MSKILYEVYKNDIKDSESVMYGKYYARLKSIETEGVMKKFKTCLLEMLLESKKVKVAGLGTFYLTAECQKGGADKEEDFNVKEHLKALHIRFLPDQVAEDNISSREFIKKAEFVNVKTLMSSTDEEASSASNTGNTTTGGNTSNTGSNTGGSSNTGGGSTGDNTGGGTQGGDGGRDPDGGTNSDE